MNTKIKAWMVSSIVVFFILCGCTEDQKGPLVTNGAVPPEVEKIQIENLPGAAKISYTFPANADILYVVAEYKIRENEIKMTKSSKFQNFLILDGFAKEIDYPITLYSVSRSDVRSQGIAKTVSPLKAPIHIVFESLSVSETFGGALAVFVNELERDYVLCTLVKDEETNEWIEYDRYFTQFKNISYAVRGLEAKPIDFAFYILDKWQNISDTLFQTLTPLVEFKLDRTLWRNMMLADDFYQPQYSTWPLENLFNDNVDDFWHTDPNAQVPRVPSWFTVDLGQPYKFSRLRYNQMNRSTDALRQFNQGSPQIFEIWATNTPTTNWDDWTFLARFESIKPSGLPMGTLNAEDRAVAEEGEYFEFPDMEESYQFIRWKTIKTWGNANYIHFCSFSLWGQ